MDAWLGNIARHDNRPAYDRAPCTAGIVNAQAQSGSCKQGVGLAELDALSTLLEMKALLMSLRGKAEGLIRREKKSCGPSLSLFLGGPNDISTSGQLYWGHMGMGLANNGSKGSTTRPSFNRQ